MHGIWLAWLALALPVSAAPVRDVGREPFSPYIEEGRAQTGFLELGGYLFNPRFAASARPDGSGTALFKYHGYLEDAVNADRVKFLADLDFLTDRNTAIAVKPVSLDYLLGVSSRFGNVRIQLDREEALALRGPGSGGWSYWDVRGAFLFGMQPVQQSSAGNRDSKVKLDGISGALTMGYLLHNHNAPARLDGTGRADWRYAAALQASFLKGRLLFKADGDVLTDRDSKRLKPVDLDMSLGIGTTWQETEFMLYRRSRESLDRSGYALYYFLALRKRFDGRAFAEP